MIDIIMRAAIAMSGSVALSLVVKATLIAGCALIAVELARSSRAAVRHLVLASTFVILTCLPFVAWMAPSIHISVPLVQSIPSSAVVTTSATETRITTASNAPSPADVNNEWTPTSLSTRVAAIWIAGAVLFAVPITAGLWQLRRIRRSGLPWNDGQLITAKLTEELRLKRAVPVLLHEAISGPLTCGLLSPSIVFPLDAQSWSDSEVRRALIHELEHVRRADSSMHAVARLVCAIYWFHPLVWMAWRKLSLEAERACDDAVLQRGDAAEYANQLVVIAKRIKSDTTTPLPAMANRSDLSTRIAAVLDAAQRRGRIGVFGIAVAVISVGVISAIVSPLRVVGGIAQQTQSQTDSRQEFEVVSVKLNRSVQRGGSSKLQPGRYSGTHVTLRRMINVAYSPLLGLQLVGGPDWIDSVGFDVEAKAAGNPTPEQLRMMMRNFLADRFKLRVHHETRELPAYALVLARADGKLGPRLVRSDVDCAPGPEQPNPKPASPGNGPSCGFSIGDTTLRSKSTTMERLAAELSLTGRQVLDRTGLTGSFDVELEWTPDAIDPATQPNGPSIFSALQEQLGLKLEAIRAPMEILVIDSAEKPAEN